MFIYFRWSTVKATLASGHYMDSGKCVLHVFHHTVYIEWIMRFFTWWKNEIFGQTIHYHCCYCLAELCLFVSVLFICLHHYPLFSVSEWSLNLSFFRPDGGAFCNSSWHFNSSEIEVKHYSESFSKYIFS